MRHLTRYHKPYVNPFGFGRELERFFDRYEGNEADDLNSFTPAVDIVETADSLKLTVELPGVNKDDVSLSIENNVLTISGEKKNLVEVNQGDFSRVERTYGSFSRSFNLSSRINNEKIDARYNNGILEVNLPKREESKPRQIEVKVK